MMHTRSSAYLCFSMLIVHNNITSNLGCKLETGSHNIFMTTNCDKSSVFINIFLKLNEIETSPVTCRRRANDVVIMFMKHS